jgi:hypothetical protein
MDSYTLKSIVDVDNNCIQISAVVDTFITGEQDVLIIVKISIKIGSKTQFIFNARITKKELDAFSKIVEGYINRKSLMSTSYDELMFETTDKELMKIRFWGSKGGRPMIVSLEHQTCGNCFSIELPRSEFTALIEELCAFLQSPRLQLYHPK